MSSRHDDLARAFADALAPAERGDATSLAQRLADSVSSADDPEASVRCRAGNVTAGRMMLERSSGATARALASGLGLPWRAECEALVEACEALRVPLIVGWDVASRGAAYKLYANASDTSHDTQRALLSALALELPSAPHVLGLNVYAAHHETKAYFQRARFADLAAVTEPGTHDAAPAALATFAHAAAWVVSCDVLGSALRARACFAAIAHGHEAEAAALASALCGAPWRTLADAFPFAPGPIRQLGWGLDGSVTVYAKRAGSAAPVHALAPAAVLATDACEVGVYVAPSATTPRAFLRSGLHAISFRTRRGAPLPGELGALATWIAAQLERPAGLDAHALESAPAPWRAVRC